MSELTLPDFLLARIAEDEAVARSTPRPPFHVVAKRTEDANLITHHALRCEPERVLAECDAKRRIVNVLSSPDPHDAIEGCPECCALYLLALPYADHPDYREEWKP